MGNTVAVCNASDNVPLKEIFQSTSSTNESVLTENRILLWKLSPDLLFLPVTIDGPQTFHPEDCFIVLHAESKPNHVQNISPTVAGLLRTLNSSFSEVDLCTPLTTLWNSSPSSLCHVYVWCGKASSDLLKSVALAKGWQLRKHLNDLNEDGVVNAIAQKSGFVSLSQALSTPGSELFDEELEIRSPHKQFPELAHLFDSTLVKACRGTQNKLPSDLPSPSVPSLNCISDLTPSPARRISSLSSDPTTSKPSVGLQLPEGIGRTTSSTVDDRGEEKSVFPLPRSGRPARSFGHSLSIDLGSHESPTCTIKIENSDSSDSSENENEQSCQSLSSQNSARKKLLAPLDINNQVPATPRLHQPSERIEYATKAAKMAFFAKDCTQLNDFMFVGGRLVAQDYSVLEAQGITHIVNCVGNVCENSFEDKLKYMKLYLLDSAAEDIMCVLYQVCDFIDAAKAEGGKVFIHCQQGVSRSTIFCIGYLMLHSSLDYDACYQLIRDKRKVTRPNVGFMCQLLSWHKRATAEGSRALYRVTPHCVHHRTRIVCKGVDKILWSSLDSRTVFIVQTPDKLFVWMGKDCLYPNQFMAVANYFVAKLQQYEKAPTNRFDLQQGKLEQSGCSSDVIDAFCEALADGKPNGIANVERVGSNSNFDEDYKSFTKRELEVLAGLGSANPYDDEIKVCAEDSEETEEEDEESLISSLYKFPELESISMFDYEDLEDDQMFVLLIIRADKGGEEQENSLHTWLDPELHVNDEFPTEDEVHGHLRAAFFAKFEQEFDLANKNLVFYQESPNNESEEFDAGFVNG